MAAIHGHNRAASIVQQRRRYASDIEIANTYGVSVLTLRKWRLFGRGPTFYKLGRAVRYDIDEVEQFVRATARGIGQVEA
ncbi:MAG: DNA-binding protein [Bryobacteraceae bacterium]|jgi:hypothetical protein